MKLTPEFLRKFGGCKASVEWYSNTFGDEPQPGPVIYEAVTKYKHTATDGWVKFCDQLKENPEAIKYWGTWEYGRWRILGFEEEHILETEEEFLKELDDINCGAHNGEACNEYHMVAINKHEDGSVTYYGRASLDEPFPPEGWFEITTPDGKRHQIEGRENAFELCNAIREKSHAERKAQFTFQREVIDTEHGYTGWETVEV